MEKNKSTVDPSKIEEEKANKKRHDDTVVKKESENYGLIHNLFLLRETYRILYKGTDVKIGSFYDALGINVNTFDNMLRSISTMSANTYTTISNSLDSTILAKKYYRASNPRPYRINKNFSDLIKEYFDSDLKVDRDYCREELDRMITQALNYGDKKLTLLMFVCNELTNMALPTTQTTLWKASETLQKLMQIDFSESDMDTEAFADFITNLAKTINSIEEDFPEFYAVAQHIKEEKTAQSIMNEITNKLNELSNMDVSSSDAQSASCLNMMNGIADVMKSVQKSLSE